MHRGEHGGGAVSGVQGRGHLHPHTCGILAAASRIDAEDGGAALLPVHPEHHLPRDLRVLRERLPGRGETVRP